VALSALTVAEYFRDVEGSTRCSSSTHLPLYAGRLRGFNALGRMPSAWATTPNLATEMGELQERITSTSRVRSLRCRPFMFPPTT